MSLFLSFENGYDVFSFSNNNPSYEIKFSESLNSSKLISYVQASLLQGKMVIILNENIDISIVNMAEVKRAHHKIEKNKFIFLNISLKNQISKLNTQQMQIENFQDLEEFFSNNLVNLF